MKKTIKIIMTAAFCLMASTGAAHADGLVIGLSPASPANRQAQEVLQFLTQTIEPGGQALLFDAWNLEVLGTFAVPDKSAYRNEKAKLNANHALVTRLLQTGRSSHLVTGQAGAIKLPQFLQFLGQSYGPLADTDIVILGSPLYIDPALPDQSMTDGKVPGDGFFAASPAQTPFSLAGRADLLKGARIHMGFDRGDLAPGSAHSYWAQRFWTLFVEGHGAVLSSFTSDHTTLWKRVQDHAGKLPQDFTREETGKLEMLKIGQAQAGDVSIFERKLSNVPLSETDVQNAGLVEIGISWDCLPCDLDLHVRSNPEAQTLNFMHMETKEGVYHKDFRQSPQAAGGFETITLNGPVDLTQTLIAVNWYGGKSPAGVQGEIRMSLKGRTYARSFKFPGSSGNQGKGYDAVLKTGTAANESWLIVPPLQILGLR